MSLRFTLRNVSMRRVAFSIERHYLSTPLRTPQLQRRNVSQAVGTGRGNPEIAEVLPEVKETNVDQNKLADGTATVNVVSNPSGAFPQASYPGGNDWSRSYHGLSTQPFEKDVADVLQAPIDSLDIEVKPGA